MSEQRVRKQEEVDKNLAFFLKELPNIPATYRGKFAVIRQQAIIGYYDTVGDAVKAAQTAYPDELYSVQQITDLPINLGYFSHALPLVAA